MRDTVTLNGECFGLRPMTGDDKAAVIAFARALPAHDLLFLNRDITQERVVAAWIEQTASGALDTLLAKQDDAIVGSAALFTDPLSWSPHVGDMRVLVASDARKVGLGRYLIQHSFRVALEKGLTKLTARMTVDQKGAITVFEELGFRGEALLKDHVRDGEGALHDIVILSCDVGQATGQIEAFGMADAE